MTPYNNLDFEQKYKQLKKELAQVTAERDALKARLDSLAEPESEPVDYQFQSDDGKWCGFINRQHYLNTLADGSFNIRPLYTHPPRQPVQLSDDEIFSAGARAGFDVDYECPDTGKYGFRNDEGTVDNEAMLRFAHAVIAAYEEKQK